jgi:hypothetical protein
MNDMSDHDLLSESVLRRALQLEPDERSPRLDAAALAAAAGQRTVLERTLRTLRGLAIVGAGVGIGLEAAITIAASGVLAQLDLTGPYGVALSFIAEAVRQILLVASVTLNPSVGVAALAAVIFASIYERTTGREPMRVRAS